MDRNTLIIKLNQIFTSWHKEEKKYQKVWLGDVHPNAILKRTYDLHVQTYKSDRPTREELSELYSSIIAASPEVNKFIYRAIIHHSEDRAYCKWDEVIFIDHQSHFLPLLNSKSL